MGCSGRSVGYRTCTGFRGDGAAVDRGCTRIGCDVGSCVAIRNDGLCGADRGVLRLRCSVFGFFHDALRAILKSRASIVQASCYAIGIQTARPANAAIHATAQCSVY